MERKKLQFTYLGLVDVAVYESEGEAKGADAVQVTQRDRHLVIRAGNLNIRGQNL